MVSGCRGRGVVSRSGCQGVKVGGWCQGVGGRGKGGCGVRVSMSGCRVGVEVGVSGSGCRVGVPGRGRGAVSVSG